MASLLSPRRSDPQIDLHATVAQSARTPSEVAQAEPPRLLWLAVSVGCAWVVALCGWIVLTGLTVLGWLAAGTSTFAAAMGVGTQLWLLAGGAGARLGSVTLTLVPWAVTLLLALALGRLAVVAVRQPAGRPLVTALRVTAVMTVAYAAPLVGVSVALDRAPALRTLVPVLAAVALAVWWGSCRGLTYHPTQSWPAWCRSVPKAVGAAQLVLVAVGVGALVTGLVLHVNRLVALTEGLHAGTGGGIVLALVQLAFVPNAVLWASSYALGAGFSLGPGSVVALTSTSHGLLPSIPLLAALPADGPGTSTHLWWLGAGVLAGGVAGSLVVRARPAARCDETSVVGGLAGLVAGLVFVGLAAASGGDLGSLRLAGLGPRLLSLLVLAPTSLGLAGMLGGLVLGLLRRRSR